MSKYERDQMEKYNGWHNYATWRINLEIFDGTDLEDISWDGMNASELAEALQEYAQEIVFLECNEKSLAYSYAMAFLRQVNWYEIAQHLLDDVQQDEEESEE